MEKWMVSKAFLSSLMFAVTVVNSLVMGMYVILILTSSFCGLQTSEMLFSVFFLVQLTWTMHKLENCQFSEVLCELEHSAETDRFVYTL